MATAGFFIVIKRISSGSSFEEAMSYSRAVVDGDTVFISGTTGFDYENMTISEDVVEQADQCFKNIGITLKEAGVDFTQVVKVNYLFTSREDFKTCWPVFKKYFGDNPPAATMVLAELYDERMKLEIEVIAKCR